MKGACCIGLWRPVAAMDYRWIQSFERHIHLFIEHHEECHRRERHALLQVIALVVCFPLAPFVRRWCEARADRAAVKAIGLHAYDAIKKVYRGERGPAESFIYGRNWKERCWRARPS